MHLCEVKSHPGVADRRCSSWWLIFIASRDIVHLVSPCLSRKTKMTDNRRWLRLVAAVWSFFTWSRWPWRWRVLSVSSAERAPPSIGYPKTLLRLQREHKTSHWSAWSTTWWELDKLIPDPKPSGGVFSMQKHSFGFLLGQRFCRDVLQRLLVTMD